MPPRLTRSRTAPAKSTKATTENNKVEAQLPPADEEPYYVFILPEKLSPEARIVSLPNPSSGTLNRYYICPTTGLYEFTKVAAPRKEPKSWLFVKADGHVDQAESQTPQHMKTNGYVSQDADAFVATPMDPLFFLFPLFQKDSAADQESGHGNMFRMEDDLLEKLNASSEHLATVLQRSSFRDLLFQRLKKVSEVREIGDETLYRPDFRKLLQVLLEKTAKMMASSAWPASMEEAHIRRPLEAPAPIVQNPPPNPEDSEQAVAGAQEVLTDVHTEPGIQPEEPAGSSVPGTVIRLMRTRVALQFMMTSYLPPSLASHLQSMLPTEVSFAPLDTYLANIAKLKAQAHALTSISDNISRKRTDMDDDEAADIRAEKRRKKEEDDLRKKNESRAVKQLKKVDTSGMKKLSSFFTKAPPKLMKGETAP